jgi:hypothetical protein
VYGLEDEIDTASGSETITEGSHVLGGFGRFAHDGTSVGMPHHGDRALDAVDESAKAP